MNSYSCTGRLGRDPELRYTPAGTAVCTLSVAVNDRYNNSEGETQERTTWMPVVLWRERAENAEKYLKKGSMIGVTGRMQQREWVDKHEQNRITLEVVGTRIDYLDRIERDPNRQQGDPGPENTPDSNEPVTIPEDDIPF